MANMFSYGANLFSAWQSNDIETYKPSNDLHSHDRFFCDTMELIPSAFYFPTDEEQNWLRTGAKSAIKKYHKNVQVQKNHTNDHVKSKKSLKRMKFTPSQQQTNEEQLIATTEMEKTKHIAKDTSDSSNSPRSVSMEGLKQRLALKIQAKREERKAAEKNHNQVRNKRKNDANDHTRTSYKKPKQQSKLEENKPIVQEKPKETNGPSISYGSLLLAEDYNTKLNPKGPTRNGQSKAKLQNLLKKAERNKQRLNELKQTEEGKVIAQQKEWNTALEQAKGTLVLDDPKRLRQKIKKKEKMKAKSAKEWKQRLDQTEQAKKKKIKVADLSASKGKKGGRTQRIGGKDKKRAGFEGKKGEGFLNGDKTKKTK